MRRSARQPGIGSLAYDDDIRPMTRLQSPPHLDQRTGLDGRQHLGRCHNDSLPEAARFGVAREDEPAANNVAKRLECR